MVPPRAEESGPLLVRLIKDGLPFRRRSAEPAAAVSRSHGLRLSILPPSLPPSHFLFLPSFPFTCFGTKERNLQETDRK